MITIQTRNVHRALSAGLYLLDSRGYARPSRNGQVIMAPFPVTTEYTRPIERVIFWPERDANPFFHLAESLWMLDGRRDLATLTRYARDMAQYSDDGVTIRGSNYGYRWLHQFKVNQLAEIAESLAKDGNDRRQVIQMWDAELDLGKKSKDLPCNLTATVQLDQEGRLDLTVFCRSNDVIWGAYGANAVHFSVLQEYLALWVGVPIGTYRQISVNYHAYSDKLGPLRSIPRMSYNDPYSEDQVHTVPMTGDAETLADFVKDTLFLADENLLTSKGYGESLWERMVLAMLSAHEAYRLMPSPKKYRESLEVLERYPDQQADWIVAGKEWINRRYDKWRHKESQNHRGGEVQ